MQENIIELDLKKYLSLFSNSRVDFYRFPGNYGDSLIYHGTKTLLDELNIDIDLVEIDSDIINDILFIDGGGNFVDEYDDVYNFLVKKYRMYKKIVLLPHTIRGKRQSKLIQSFGPNITIFCREKVTYEFVKNNAIKVEYYLWNDCAFYNDLKNYSEVGKGTLNSFRVDVESNKKELPADNEDISYDGWCMKPLQEFLVKIQKYEEVRTDRLHVAIASAMLGKRVLFYSNSYYKNMAVYEYSLKKYPEVIFIYENDYNLVSYSQIRLVFLEHFNNETVKTKGNILDLFSELIFINHKLWHFEDLVRNLELTDKLVRETKRRIDKANQLRNDIIRKIDFNLISLLNNKESKDIEKFVSESPAVFIDRLSIMFIRKFEIESLVFRIKDNKNLNNIYNQKLNVINKQIDFNGNFLDVLFDRIRLGTVFFKIFNPIKIYNDNNIQKYLNRLQQDIKKKLKDSEF
ncbi:DUF4254 domain-containing protein [Patescibacteria group bacterium]|nr:DUF4254 domain-containing protein [Patescibacteria group bacterium]